MIAENEDRPNRTKAKPLPPIEYLRELFIVDPSSPSGLRWRANRGGVKAGSVAGWFHKHSTDSNRHDWLVCVYSKTWIASRIIFFITYGNIPDGMAIDHINGNSLDNRIENLRLATSQQNNRNRRISSNNRSGIRGVCWDPSSNKWRAHIEVNGKHHNLGRFDSLVEARCIRRRAEVQLFGEFSSIHRKEGV